MAVVTVIAVVTDEPDPYPSARPSLRVRVERTLDHLGLIPHDPFRFVEGRCVGSAE
jgi:hypothetical protein